MNTTPNEAIVEACAELIKQTPFHLRAQIIDILANICSAQYLAGYRDANSQAVKLVEKLGA